MTFKEHMPNKQLTMKNLTLDELRMITAIAEDLELTEAQVIAKGVKFRNLYTLSCIQDATARMYIETDTIPASKSLSKKSTHSLFEWGLVVLRSTN